MVRFVEMLTHCFPVFFTGDVIEMTLESLCYTAVCLAHILFFADFASYQVDQIITFASDVFQGTV